MATKKPTHNIDEFKNRMTSPFGLTVTTKTKKTKAKKTTKKGK